MQLIKYPSALLKRPCEPVTEFDENLVNMLKEMSQDVITFKGLALAANQVGILKRFFVVCERMVGPKWIINPVILNPLKYVRVSESCLSIPDVNAYTNRFEKLTLQYQDCDGTQQHFDAEGLYAQMVQHEIDHLDGKLFIDGISIIENNRISAKLNKLRTRK